MRLTRIIVGCLVAGLVLGTTVVTTPGCGGNGLFGLQDYQRDLFFGGLAAALLAQQRGQQGVEPTPGSPGRDGDSGINCWDLNGDGVDDPEEDVNGDGEYNALDCKGGPGADGADGTPGVGGSDGQDGADGLSCWDLDGDGVADPNEDTNGDGSVDVLDCRGPAGSDGSSGSDGAPGADGPEFFDVFIDDFFTFDDQQSALLLPGDSLLTVGVVQIDEPVLQFAEQSPIAYRVAIPGTYESDNDVTMRLFLYRTGLSEGDCFVFTLDPRRLRNGSDIEVYGDNCDGGGTAVDQVCGRRWVRLDLDEPAGSESDPGTLVVVDLPLNTAAGLDLERDLADVDKLAGGQFLAFEINKSSLSTDDRAYQLLGVEFFESSAGGATLSGATVYFTDEVDPCVFTDCNENGTSDSQDIADQSSIDCNTNGIPDECEVDCNTNGVHDTCDIADGTSFDCDENGVPDECAACPPVDLVFVMDTSGSMDDEAAALCDSISQVVADLRSLGIEVNPSFLGIMEDVNDEPLFVCLTNSVLDMLGGQVPNSADTLNDTEDWGPATAIVADRFPWTAGAVRIIVPISDEDPQDGDGCNQGDTDAIAGAIAVANAANVFVSPIVAELEPGGCDPAGDPNDCLCILPLATQLADETGGSLFQSTDPGADLAGAINDLVVDVCRSVSDCNNNGIPDACEVCTGEFNTTGLDCLPDCDTDGIPDECDDPCSECETDADCDDEDFCTVDYCFEGVCHNEGYCECASDSDCDDADACTIDACEQGQCVNSPIECIDGLVCVNGECVD